MPQVKDMSIRAISRECFVSTTTMFRFVRKLGFEGYSDFINYIRLTSIYQNDAPSVPHPGDRSEHYLSNLRETIRVLNSDKIELLYQRMERRPSIFFLAEGPSSEVAASARYFFSVLNFPVFFPQKRYEFTSMVNQITDNDIIFSMSYSGTNSRVIDTVERVFLKKHPFLVSITGPQNNPLRSLSDVNFYAFSDEEDFNGFDITSRVPILLIIEILLHGWIERVSSAPSPALPEESESEVSP